MRKIYSSVDDAVADVADGATIMFGGFGGAGFPNNLIQGVARRGERQVERRRRQTKIGAAASPGTKSPSGLAGGASPGARTKRLRWGAGQTD